MTIYTFPTDDEIVIFLDMSKLRVLVNGLLGGAFVLMWVATLYGWAPALLVVGK